MAPSTKILPVVLHVNPALMSPLITILDDVSIFPTEKSKFPDIINSSETDITPRWLF